MAKKKDWSDLKTYVPKKRKVNRAPFDIRWGFCWAYVLVGLEFLLTGKLPRPKKVKKAKKSTRKPKATSKRK